jgi:hypothetical protein
VIYVTFCSDGFWCPVPPDEDECRVCRRGIGVSPMKEAFMSGTLMPRISGLEATTSAG